MKLIPIGVGGNVDGRKLLKAENYGNSLYDGIQLREDSEKKPVIIMRSRKESPFMWKVVYGFSQVFFRSFSEAVDFCNSRGFRQVKKQIG